MRNLLTAYTSAVLPFQLGQQQLSSLPEFDEQTQAKQLTQALRSATRTGKPYFLLLGTGDGRLADALQTELPEHVTLVQLDLTPQRVRDALAAGHLTWWQQNNRHVLLTDTSPWALLTLLTQVGITADNAATMLHPSMQTNEREALQHCQRLFTASRLITPEAPAATIPLTVAAILHPDEPKLDKFFEHIPSSIHNMIVVWDAESVPDCAPAALPQSGAPITHKARPLANDFAAQRNHALAQCSTDWILFLDGDERLTTESWERIPALLNSNIGGYALPRQTFITDDTTCRAGFGLWPDIQLRLFRKGEQTTFIRPIHEIVTNLPGPTALCLTESILHYSHVWKTQQQLAEKLQNFNAAAGKNLHLLNEEYPIIPQKLLETLASLPSPGSYLLLPNL